MFTRESAINTALEFVADCQTAGLSFDKVLLFGSAAKNTMHEWSDVDLLLVSNQFSDNIFENLKLYSKINIKYPNIETHPYPTTYYEVGDDFINEVSREAVELLPLLKQ